MNTCPKCYGAARMTSSRINHQGRRTRRFHCCQCDHRWNEIGGGPIKRAARLEPCAPEVVEAILTSSDSDSKLAKRFCKSRSFVYKVRHGQLHSDVRPDLPRLAGCVTCEECHHWQPHRDEPCDLGHCDPQEMGIGFARWCINFRSAAQQVAA